MGQSRSGSQDDANDRLAAPSRPRKGEMLAPNIPLISLPNAAKGLAMTARSALSNWDCSKWTPIRDVIGGSIAIINFWSLSKDTSTVPVDM